MKFLSALYPGEMITITEQWTGALQPVFLSVPEIANLLPRVQKDHDALLGARSAATAEGLFQTLSDKATTLDKRHDHGVRALHYGLWAAEQAALSLDPPDTAFAAQIAHAHEVLLPWALEVITTSYEAEAGNAAQMVKLADTELAPVLSKLPIGQGMSALDLVHHIGQIGGALGTTEHEKSEAAAAAEKESVPASEVKRRMRKWAATVELVCSALSDTGAPADAVAKLSRPVLEAAEKARIRRLSGASDEEKKVEGTKVG